MEQLNENYKHPEFDTGEENSDFSLDVVLEWILKILKYWYLFVITVGLCSGYAYLQNRKWKPKRHVAARVIIDEGAGRSSRNNDVMQGFGVQMGYKNVNNQLVMFGSYDLIGRTLEKLPFDVEYYTEGRFKTTSLYKASPVEVKAVHINQTMYEKPILLTDNNDGTFTIAAVVNEKEISSTGKYGELKSHAGMFDGIISEIPGQIKKEKLYFKFKTHQSLKDDFNSRLTFDYAKQGSSVVEVSLDGFVPEMDKDFIDALCDEFLMDNLNRKNDEANKTISFINEQLSVIEDSLEVSGRKMADFRQSNMIVNMGSYTGRLSSAYSAFEEKRSELKLTEAYFNYLTNYLNEGIEDESIIMPSSLGVTDSYLSAQVAKYVELQVKKKMLGPQNPYIRKYQQEIEVIKESLLEILKNMQVSLDIEKKNLGEQEKEVMTKIVDLPEKEKEIGTYERRYKINDNYYTYLLQKRSEAQILKASNSPDNIILERARMLHVVNGKDKRDTTTKYLLIGLFLPILFVILKELLRQTISSAKEIGRITKSMPIGNIIHTDNHTDKILTLKYSRSSFAESFRDLKTRIEFIVMRKENIAVLITSTEPGDGKTYFSSNLAGIYSLTGKKVLLLDLDLRKNSIQELFRFSKRPGISDFLIDEKKDIHEYIIKNEYKFDILLSGTIPPNPNELTKSEKFQEMIKSLKKEYDFIIMDTNPIGVVSDAYSIMEHADVNLYIVRDGYTNKRHFKNVVETIRSHQIPNIYYVMNDIEVGKRSYYYGYGYGRYRAYGKGYISSKYYHDEDTGLVKKKSIFKKIFGL